VLNYLTSKSSLNEGLKESFSDSSMLNTKTVLYCIKIQVNSVQRDQINSSIMK